MEAGSPTSPSHLHLWSLPDGTGLHAPYGDLAVDDDTLRLCCHLCGRWYVSLGAHVRAHGHTADTYRQTMGLCATQPLTSTPLSSTIAKRQGERYRRDVELRARLDAGRQTLRSAPRSAAPSDGQEPVQRQRRRTAALESGRRTIAARRHRELDRRLHEWGDPRLHDFLRRAYDSGASLEDLGRRTGLGRARLRTEMGAAGIAVRAVGHNSAEARRSRALTHEAAAARQVGTDDIHTWLTDRSGEGWSLGRLAAAVGHSTPWVRVRLADRSPSAGGRRGRQEAGAHR